MKNNRPTRGDKREVREETHMTRPPRMEGKVKEANMKTKKKKPRVKVAKKVSSKQGITDAQRKAYHLKSAKH